MGKTRIEVEAEERAVRTRTFNQSQLKDFEHGVSLAVIA